MGYMTLSHFSLSGHSVIMKFMTLLKTAVPHLMDIQTRGLSNIPKEGPAILVGDHPNIMDGIALAVASPRPVRILVAAELCTSPMVEKMIRNLGWLPVERHKAGQNGDIFAECIEALENGEVVAIFPEGKTNYGKELLPFKAGAALLAHKSGAPVIPFSVKGTEELYPDGSKTLRSGRVVMNFGKPKSFAKHTTDIPSGFVSTTLNSMRESILELQDEVQHIRAGRMCSIPWHGIAAAAVIKSLTLALLTVKWK